MRRIDYKKLVNFAFIGIFGLGTVSPIALNLPLLNREKIENRIDRKVATETAEKIENRVREKVQNMLTTRAVILGGKVAAKRGTTLIVNKDGKDYTVITDTKTQFRRLFWGKSSLDEISVNDMINVHGKWVDEAKTQIQATLVRNLSIQKRFGVFFGEVTSLVSNGFIVKTVARGDQTVTVSSSTKFVNRRGETIPQSDILVNHRVRIRGLWDRTNSVITEVTEVKDFSLPTQAGLPVKVTSTPTVTP